MLVRMIARQAQRPTGVTYVTLALRSHTLHSFTPLAPASTPLNLSPTPPPHEKSVLLCILHVRNHRADGLEI